MYLILADSINLPIVFATGLMTLGPLTLLVTAVEVLVFRLYLKTRFRKTFVPVLVANLLSTLAGGLVLAFQDSIVEATGIMSSIPAFVRGYCWVALLLIACYFLKSVLVEGLWLTRRSLREKLGRQRWPMVRAIVIGNILSYLIVGPLFYLATRPHFSGLETTFDTSWTRNADTVAYYIDSRDQNIKRTRLDGNDTATLVPFPAQSFLVSEDESTIVYFGPGGSLYAYSRENAVPTLLHKSDRGGFITSASLSPDNRRVAFVTPLIGQDWGTDQNDRTTIQVFDLAGGEADEITSIPENGRVHALAWSADGHSLFAKVEERAYKPGSMRIASSQTLAYVFDSAPPFNLREKSSNRPREIDLAVNYMRAQGFAFQRSWIRGLTIEPSDTFEMGDYRVNIWPHLMSHVAIRNGEQAPLVVRSEYGLLDWGFPLVESAVALPSQDEILIDWWSQLYVLSIKHRKLGLLADGVQCVLRTPEFRVTFD